MAIVAGLPGALNVTAPRGGTHVLIRAAEVELRPPDHVRGKRVEVLAETDAEPMIVGARELDFVDIGPDEKL